jgi:mRNA interferase MazF
MPSFEPGDVIKVPFPYTDRATRQRRPALVVSSSDLVRAHGLLWVLMITSAENRPWPGDIAIGDLADAGLPAPSVIRTAKIATIDADDVKPLGKVSARICSEALRSVAATLRFGGDG